MNTFIASRLIVALLFPKSFCLLTQAASADRVAEVYSQNGCVEVREYITGEALTLPAVREIVRKLSDVPLKTRVGITWIVATQNDLDWLQGALRSDEPEEEWRRIASDRSRHIPVLARLTRFGSFTYFQFRGSEGNTISEIITGGSKDTLNKLRPIGYAVAYILPGTIVGKRLKRSDGLDVFIVREDRSARVPVSILTRNIAAVLRCRVHSLTLRDDYAFHDSRLPYYYPFSTAGKAILVREEGIGEVGWCLNRDGNLVCEDHQ